MAKFKMRVTEERDDCRCPDPCGCPDAAPFPYIALIVLFLLFVFGIVFNGSLSQSTSPPPEQSYGEVQDASN
jgi:hypothetical protein